MLWKRRLAPQPFEVTEYGSDAALELSLRKTQADYFPEVLLVSGAFAPDPPDIPFMLPEGIPAEPMFEAPNACPR
jgi:hypothetical protein